MVTIATQHKLDTSKIKGQRQFMESLAPEILYSGAFGAGKSRIGCEKALYLSLAYPGNRGLITRKKYTDLRDTTQDTFFRYVCPEEYIKTWLKQEHKLILQNGSEILFIGVDQPAKVGSLEVGWIFADEIIEFTEEDYLMLLGRLRHPVPFHQIFGATNPSYPEHWVYKRFFEDEELKANKTVQVIESNALENPFTPESYKERLRTFKGRYYQRFVLGKWIGFEGLVYDNWDPTKFILDRTTTRLGLTGNSYDPIPSDWERYRVIDFGFTNPFVCQWWASQRYEYIGEPGKQDRVEIPFHQRIWVMYREIYYSGRPVDEHAKQIVRLSAGETIATTIADWAAGDRAIMEREGIPTIKANKDVSPGIQSVYDTIEQGRIFILRDSLVEGDNELVLAKFPTRTTAEFQGYQKFLNANGKYNPKEEPVKRHDHGMDALRYLMFTLDAGQQAGSQIHHGTKSGLESVPQNKTLAEINSSPSTPSMIFGGSRGRKWGDGNIRKWRSML